MVEKDFSSLVIFVKLLILFKISTKLFRSIPEILCLCFLVSLRPKGKQNYKVTEDREDEKEVEVTKEYSSNVDQDASWLKKRSKLHFGFKKHHVTDNEGLELGVVTTKANVNEIANLDEVLDAADLPEGIQLKADKGYQSEKNAQILKTRKLKNHI